MEILNSLLRSKHAANCAGEINVQ